MYRINTMHKITVGKYEIFSDNMVRLTDKVVVPFDYAQNKPKLKYNVNKCGNPGFKSEYYVYFKK